MGVCLFFGRSSVAGRLGGAKRARAPGTCSGAGRRLLSRGDMDPSDGDGDVAFRAGVECHKGDADGGMQPPTLMYQMRGVDVQALRGAIVQHPDIYDMDNNNWMHHLLHVLLSEYRHSSSFVQDHHERFSAIM